MTQGEAKIVLKVDSSARSAALLPIIRFCLKNSAKLEHRAATAEKPFVDDKSGVETCTLISHITVKDILKRYSLPDHITHGEYAF